MKPHINRVKFAHDFLSRIFAGNLHAKRIESLANGTLGVMTSASLAVSIIGHSLAQARGLIDKHAIKQVDRLLSNRGIVVWEIFASWVREVVGPRKEIVVAIDWTDFDADDQTTLALNLVTRHGRATPLLWLTVSKDELKDRRNDWEDLCLSRLAEVLPEGVAVTILADRGFGDTKLFAFLDELGFAYVIRFRGNIHVTAADGETRPAADWVGKGGRARKLRDAEVTAGRHKVGAVVCVHARGMKEPWCLAASDGEASARVIMNHYAKRWTIDIDQAWRLSRFCCWGGVSAFDPWRGLPPMRRGRSNCFQGRDRLGIRQDQFGALGAGASAAARQSALLDPGVKGRLRHPDFFGEFANRPFVRPALDPRRTSAIFDGLCA